MAKEFRKIMKKQNSSMKNQLSLGIVIVVPLIKICLNIYLKAFYNLGMLYYNGGQGVPQNYHKAIEILEKVAYLGNSDGNYNNNYLFYFILFYIALSNLGLIYNTGQGVPQNYEKAKEYYEKAMLFGNFEGLLMKL